MGSSLQKLQETGQSLWYDNIQRCLLENGEMAAMIENGDIRGVTSNPSIFHKAIANSNDYDEALKTMAWSGWNAENIFYQVAIEDIQSAADLFLPIYEQTEGEDGYVSLEVSPYLAHDTEGTIAEAKALWKRVKRPNLMIKIPATLEGLPAISETIADGINVNVTLIFSIERYKQVLDAYMSGLEKRLATGSEIKNIASVASFFVSRLDAKVDAALHTIVKNENKERAETANALLGKAAIANTQMAYALFLDTIEKERFVKLQKQGAKYQRPLWASTSTKDPSYSDILYVESLIAPNTVNTVPPKTLEAYRDHGSLGNFLERNTTNAKKVFTSLANLGISIEQITQELEAEGVKSFSDAFTALLDTTEERCKDFQSELGPLKDKTFQRVKQLEEISAAKRIHEHDATLWTDNPSGQEEIKKRLEWLTAPYESQRLFTDLFSLAGECLTAGYTHVLLLGMGGSSLAPEVMSLIFGNESKKENQGLNLAILDSTDPAQVRQAENRAPIEKTLFIVSSKSGSTSEVKAFLDYFWKQANDKLQDKAAEHFIAITDPGSALEKLARERKFRRVFTANPGVGGRYSALIAFGLAPAALAGIDLVQLLAKARHISKECQPDVPAGRNPGLVLGAILGEAALNGRDKLRLLTDPNFEPFGSWLEQLIAESSGKENKGIVPVVSKLLTLPTADNQDRLYVYLRQTGQMDQQIEQIRKTGLPVLTIPITSIYDLGKEFYRWEIATAVACVVLGVNAFDQPDVQDSKTRTTNKISTYRQHGKLDDGQPIWQNQEATIYGKEFSELDSAKTLKDVFQNCIKQIKPGDYFAINAYLPRDETTQQKLEKLQLTIQKQANCVVTIGYGPRFLHSTGQLHKGGADNGVFLILTDEPDQDIEIPEQGLTFGTLQTAQALGDLEALLTRNRRAIRIHLKKATLESLI